LGEEEQQQNRKAQLSQTLKGAVPDPEVVPVATRRQFSAAYKQRILEEADGCEEPGQVGELLRREGLYSSHLARWRKQRSDGQLKGLASLKRGRKADAQTQEVEQLRAENERLQAQLEQAELIMEVQKKLSQLLGRTLNENGSSAKA
jgi:transposase-like protein